MSDTSPTSLRIRYNDPEGNQTELALAEKPITIGRSPDADIITLDERASRMHCGIRIWDGEYYVKDLKSKNGTYLNNQRVEMAKIKPGDKIRLGNTILNVDDKKSPGTATTIDNLQHEMSEGKGYKTILREIVENTEKPMSAPLKPTAAPKPDDGAIEIDGAGTAVDEPRTKTARLVSPPPGDSKKISIDPPASGSKLTSVSDSKIVRRAPPTAIRIKRS
jgi:pSer/pThr/pTyr-binding forkhead associated (FHA) protein